MLASLQLLEKGKVTCSCNTQISGLDVEDTASPGLRVRPGGISVKALVVGENQICLVPRMKGVALIAQQVPGSLSHEMVRLSLSGND